MRKDATGNQVEPEAGEEALRALDEDAVIRDLQALVRLESITGEERDAAEFVVDRAREFGLSAELEEEDVAALRVADGWPGEEVERQELVNARVVLDGTGDGRLALCAHLDVVHPGKERWKHGNPFSGVIDDGKLFGRGSADMKAGVIAALHALAAVRLAGIETAPAHLLAVSSEEDGGLGAFAALRRDAAYTGCVIPEPTGFDVACAQAGAITFKGTILGKSAHAAHRLRGVSALDRYLPIHKALADYEEAVNRNVVHPLMRRLSLPYPVLVGRLTTGTWSSQVPDRLEFEGRAPVEVGQTVADAKAAVESAIASATKVDASDPRLGRVELTWSGGSFASCEIDPAHPFVRSVSGAVADELKRDVRDVGVPWGADMRLFHAKGIPTVMCGPAGIERAHAVDEWVACDEVITIARALIRLVCRFHSIASP